MSRDPAARGQRALVGPRQDRGRGRAARRVRGARAAAGRVQGRTGPHRRRLPRPGRRAVRAATSTRGWSARSASRRCSRTARRAATSRSSRARWACSTASPAAPRASRPRVAGLLRAPVVLVVDVAAMGQSVAALVHGFRTYDELVWLGGVVLNRAISNRHEQLLREALDDIGVPVLGALRRGDLAALGAGGAALPPREHGLVPVVHRTVEALRGIAPARRADRRRGRPRAGARAGPLGAAAGDRPVVAHRRASRSTSRPATSSRRTAPATGR